ncbi:cell division cycle-associated protein 2 isoform X1 [Phasianus colchicus]|nr:cell division cycle-associated protein 2 isoform X1 [Phasianus colchicus]XP_031463921.1 cell division cycle-associated protein 2 isoform X1 [Phasianus colchicus]XP_031463923.1 cell division cycle-associated protein 2 isoform X1 [Phasianus colchicus]
MASEKENVSNGAEDREQESHLDAGDAESHQWAECPSDTPKRAVVGEAAWPLSSKENVSGGPVPLGDECYSTPARVKAGEKSCCGLSEKQRRKSVDFASVTTADFGITPESFVNGSTAKSPAALKLRRRSAIGARGSPENNTLIQYLAQQKSSTQKEAFTQQASPCQFARSLRSKMDIFQRTFKSVEEAEGKTGFSGLSQVSAARQEDGCLALNKAPVTKEHSLDQKREAFMSDCNGADLKENLKENLTNSNKSGRSICTILSLQQDVTEPAAVSKEQTYKQGNPIEYSEAVLIRDILETSHVFSSDCISKEVRSNVISDQSRKKVNFAEELIVGIYDESKPPVTPLQTRNASLRESTPSSQLRSVLKKTPVKQLMDCMKEYSNHTVHRGGGESFTVSDHICEALQTVEKTEQYSPKSAKKKKVTFGEDLSPEIFDKTLPANTPLRKGSTPVCRSGSERGSPFTRAGLTEEPLTQPNFDCSDECIVPPQELQEGSVVSEKLLPVENTKEAETDKSDMKMTRSSTKRKYSTISEGTDCSISRTASNKNAKDIKNPRKNELQRSKSVTVSAAKKKQKTKRATFGKRRKRKVKKSLYGEREMASKKPLLSPILEIPEVFSSASSPNSPKAIAHFLDHSTPRDVHNDVQQEQVTERMREKIIPVVYVYPSSEELDIVEEGSPCNTVFQFPNVVPDTNDVLNTCDCFQQAEETACLKGKTESDFLIEHEKFQGDIPKKEEWLTELEFPNQEDTDVCEALQRTECPSKRSSRGRPPRRSSSIVNIPPVEKSHFEMTGDDLQFSSFDVEEVLSAPQLKNNSLKKLSRKSRMSSETSRVRRSMRLQKDAEIEGLAWIEVTNEILQNPSVPAPACKTRRRISTSVLTESENIHHGEENLNQFAASGKENSVSVHGAGGPCRRRRKSICVSTPQETRTLSRTRKRSITNSVHRRDSSNQEYSEEMNIPLQNNIAT